MKIKTVNSAQTPPIAASKSRIVKFCIMVIPKLLILKGFLLVGAKVNPLPQNKPFWQVKSSKTLCKVIIYTSHDYSLKDCAGGGLRLHKDFDAL
jgi:hypothetical protein